MVDSQFQSQNGGTGTVAPAPGISLIVAPQGNAPTPEPNKWVEPQPQRKEGKKIQIVDNMSTVDRVVICAAEFAGTAILVFLGCMGCVVGITGGKSIPHEQISLTFGFAVMISLQSVGHVSGAHINPVITVARAALGKLPLIQIPIYFTGQLLGALAGFGLLKVVTPSAYMGATYKNASDPTSGYIPGVCSPGVNPSLTSLQALLVEFTASFILALVACGVWDYRNNKNHDSIAIKFGFAVATLAMAAGPYTGANMNPMRSFAPALLNGDWDHHWIYWVGPLAGAFFCGLLYRLIFDNEPTEERNNIPEGLPLSDKA